MMIQKSLAGRSVPDSTDQSRTPRPWYVTALALGSLVASVVLVVSLAGQFSAARLSPENAVSSPTTGAVSEPGSDTLAEAIREVDPIARAYFGTLELAQGSSIVTGVNAVGSLDEISLIASPTDVDIELFGDASGLRLSIGVPDNHPTGPVTLVFDIEGEPEPVSWQFIVSSR